MVRTAKKQGKYVNLIKIKNDENNHSTWSYSKCKEYLIEYRVIKIGKLEALRRRCNLHYLLVQKNLQHVLNLIKTETKEACRSFFLLKGSGEDMVEKIGNTLLNNYSVANDRYVLTIDNNDGIDKAIAD